MLLVWVVVSLVVLCRGDESPQAHLTGWTDEMVDLHEMLMLRLRGGLRLQRRRMRKGMRDYGKTEDGPDDELIRRNLARAQNCKAVKALELDRKHMLEQVKVFLRTVYPKRPIHKNGGGMRFTHMFNLWYLLRKLEPKYVVESGVYEGQTTWLIRNALPDAEIYSFDPFDNRRFIDPKTHYQIPERRKRNRDQDKDEEAESTFKDFSQFNWDHIKDKDKVVVLFDDHQSFLKRVKQGIATGFKHFIIDDNYYPLMGDLYSAKQICDESGGRVLRGANFTSDQVLVADNFNIKDSKFISKEEHLANRQWFLDNVKTYHEFPPLLQVPGQLGDPNRFMLRPHQDVKGPEHWTLAPLSRKVLKYMMKYTMPSPLITSVEEFEATGISQLPPYEMGNYAFLGYVEMN